MTPGTLTAMTTTAEPDQIEVDRSLRLGDVEAIAELHRRLYVPEYGMNDEFVCQVAEGVEAAVAVGWPETAGAVWLVRQGGLLRGSLALTDEGDGLGRPRWFALEAPLRGRGLGRQLVGELVVVAREAGMRRLELETFSALSTAARIYRSIGFSVTSERERTDWGVPIVYQHYSLDL
jgi:GNAT superfamily N-acetyltransferase